VATPGAVDLGIDPWPYLARHLAGDWGDLDPADVAENQFRLEHGLRLLSAYNTPAGRLCIITEADRSVTMFLLPDEYQYFVLVGKRSPIMETETIEVKWMQEKAMRADLKALIDELNEADLLLLGPELMERFGRAAHEEKDRCGLSFDTDYE
jgi:hypothetical protein